MAAGLNAAAGDCGTDVTTEVMDMTLPPGEAAPPAAICIGRTPADIMGLMVSCGLAETGATLDAEDVEVEMLGLGESCDGIGEAGDIGVLLLLLYVEPSGAGEKELD